MNTKRLPGSIDRVACLAVLCLVAAGCDLIPMSAEISKNPVAPPPPTRMLQDIAEKEELGKSGVARLRTNSTASNDDDELPDLRTADLSSENQKGPENQGRIGVSGAGWKPAGSVQRASFEELAETPNSKLRSDAKKPEPLVETQVAAYVNGVPILVGDVLEPFAAGLAKSARQYSPEEMQKFRRFLVAKHLQTHIEQQLLINALKTKVKDEQLQSVESQLEKAFSQELQKMYKHYKVSTIAELDAELSKHQTTVQATKTAFRKRKLAEQWMAYCAAPKTQIERSELLAYYKEHQADYESPARLKWQQITISFEKHGGAGPALDAANKLLDELQTGANFDELAKKHSSGPTAREGGHWDWVRKGSLADQGLEKLLFDMSNNEIAGPYRSKAAFDIVRITGREELTRKSFESVQDQIRTKLRASQIQAAADKVLRDLREQANIEILVKSDDIQEARNL